MSTYTDTFLKACTKWKIYKEEGNFKAWLYTIAKNLHINRYRRDQRAGRIISLDNLYYLPSKVDESNLVISKLYLEQVKEAIDTLPDQFKTPATLFFFESFTYREIADEINIPLGTVKSRIHRSRKRIKHYLKEDQDGNQITC